VGYTCGRRTRRVSTPLKYQRTHISKAPRSQRTNSSRSYPTCRIQPTCGACTPSSSTSPRKPIPKPSSGPSILTTTTTRVAPRQSGRLSSPSQLGTCSNSSRTGQCVGRCTCNGRPAVVSPANGPPSSPTTVPWTLRWSSSSVPTTSARTAPS
jgi:hypothetical protein